ncbi:MAG: hypothetical protein A3A73_02230 [Omnitrophica bacterium RIFCSPLOWO2_01_FULL_50_24]|nr:MAG: hypothetical protein A3A73_02230 [Omnitrophica bacterium RIFCSPLOWO2_01_FULL_50_24]
MKTVPLKAEYRSELGKQKVKKIRAAKQIPAVVYGSGSKAMAIQVATDDFFRVVHTKVGENVIIDLKVSGPKKMEKTVVIKEIQHDPITDAVEHIDFNIISLTEKIKVNVPLHVTGESIGVKEDGVLDVVHHEIEVECLPTDIPERIPVDITSLKIGDSVHIKELSFPSGVTPTLEENEVVVAVHAPRVEEEPVPAEGEAAEPEVVGKEKKEEGVEGGEAAPPAQEAKKEKSADKDQKEKKE